MGVLRVHVISVFLSIYLVSISAQILTSSASNKELGINCQGSSLCLPEYGLMWFFRDLSKGTLRKPILSNLNYGPVLDEDVYPPGRQIICKPNIGRPNLPWGGFCVFTQDATSGVNGTVIKQKLDQLVGHECAECGSVPLADDNNPATEGILTVNAVKGKVCPGVCERITSDQTPGIVEDVSVQTINVE